MTAYRLIPFLWGFAEAIFFFIVPDVWLTYLVCVNGWKGIWRALCFTVAGALTGGLCVYFMGSHWPSEMDKALDWVPGISQTMVANAWQDLSARGGMAMAIGILKGIPYKIFAAGAGSLRMNLATFIAVSFMVRSIRFLFSILITKGICRLCEARISRWSALRLPILCGFWAVFYAFYFRCFGW